MAKGWPFFRGDAPTYLCKKELPATGWPWSMAKQIPFFSKIFPSHLTNLLHLEKATRALQIPPQSIKNPALNVLLFPPRLGTDQDLGSLRGGRCWYHYPEPYLAQWEAHHDSSAIPHGIRCSPSAWKSLPGPRLAQKDAQINWLFLCWSWAFFLQ